MAFCSGCGAQMSSDERFCVKCGADQKAQAAGTPAVPSACSASGDSAVRATAHGVASAISSAAARATVRGDAPAISSAAARATVRWDAPTISSAHCHGHAPGGAASEQESGRLADCCCGDIWLLVYRNARQGQHDSGHGADHSDPAGTRRRRGRRRRGKHSGPCGGATIS